MYITTADGVDCGHVDLKLRTIVVTQAEFEGVLRDCLARMCPDVEEEPPPLDTHPTHIAVPPSDSATPVSEPAAAEPDSPAGDPASAPTSLEPIDLVKNIGGAAARAKRNEVNAQAPFLNFAARVMGVKTDERNWRVGAKGEEKVAIQLSRLGDGWRRIHAVPVGERGSDIDHVVMGPPGVFTLNTKRHPGGRAWVGEWAVKVNGHKTDYLRNSRFEAKRASELLSAACGFPLAVKPVIVFVDLDDFTVKQMPADVHVVWRRGLVAWLKSLQPTLDPAVVEAVFEVARRSTTWQPPKP